MLLRLLLRKEARVRTANTALPILD